MNHTPRRSPALRAGCRSLAPLWLLWAGLWTGCATPGPDAGMAGSWVLQPEASELPHGEWAVELDLSLEGRDLVVDRRLVQNGVPSHDVLRFRTDGTTHRVPNGHPHEAPRGWSDERDVVAAWTGSALEVSYQRPIREVPIPYREVWRLEGPDVLEVQTTYQGDRVAQTIREIYARQGTAPDLTAYIKRADRVRECWGGGYGRAAHDPTCVPRKDADPSAPPADSDP